VLVSKVHPVSYAANNQDSFGRRSGASKGPPQYDPRAQTPELNRPGEAIRNGDTSDRQIHSSV
jgi:hypothetical protein